MTRPRLIRAAGCVVWRYGNHEPEVLLVHRPRLDDWSFPKGKLDRGETDYAAAVREVDEETGIAVKLGPRLPDQFYTVGGVPKKVAYWSAKPPASADIAKYVANHEVDDLRWVRVSKARKKLSYPHDGDLLEDFVSSAFDSSPLIIVRHAEARARKGWHKEDSERPLKAEGRAQTRRVADLLAAYGITRLISSDAVRCVDTVLPYSNEYDVKLTLDSSISEEGMAKGKLARRIERQLKRERRVAICSHRPVLPAIFEAAGVEPVTLDTAGAVVLHRRKGTIVDVEIHP